jgi:cyanate permease
VSNAPDGPEPEPRHRDTSTDPVRVRRAKIQRLASLGQRIGYLLYAVAMIAFFYGFFVDFNGTVVTVIVSTMAVGSAALAPAIVLGYAVKAAERDDLEHGR